MKTRQKPPPGRLLPEKSLLFSLDFSQLGSSVLSRHHTGCHTGQYIHHGLVQIRADLAETGIVRVAHSGFQISLYGFILGFGIDKLHRVPVGSRSLEYRNNVQGIGNQLLAFLKRPATPRT